MTSLFGTQNPFGQQSGGLGQSTSIIPPTTSTSTTSSSNSSKDIEIPSPPNDTVSCLRFSPDVPGRPSSFLVGGSWDNNVRCWEIQQNGVTPKAQQSMQGPILDCAWSDDGSKVFMASCDKQVKVWDLASNQAVTQVAQHNAPVKSVKWVKAPNYSALMTGSFDGTVKFWDMRSPNPIVTIDLNGNRVLGMDVIYPVAVVALSNQHVSVISLEGQPKEVKRLKSDLTSQLTCISLFRDKKTLLPVGYALASNGGRATITHINEANSKNDFAFKCHRSPPVSNASAVQDIFSVNGCVFHPQFHASLATIGSDGKYYFWDKDVRNRLFISDSFDQPITCCDISPSGQLFAYALGYDWSKGHEYSQLLNPNNSTLKPRVRIRPCFDDMKEKKK